MSEVAKQQVAFAVSTQMLLVAGPLPGDEEEYVERTRPYRGGILSERRLRDKRVTRARHVQDSEALRHALRWLVEDYVDYRSWGHHEAAEVGRLRARVEEVFSYLTPEQRAEVYRRSEEARAKVAG